MAIQIDPVLLETLGTLLAALLTVMVLSFVLGDNAFFRIATYLFVGVASGYAAAVAWQEVLQPRLLAPLFNLGSASFGAASFLTGVVFPMALVALLALRLVPGAGRLGGLPVAMLIGVGAAAVVGGAITGTLVPQTMAAMESFSPFAVAPQTGETGLEHTATVLLILLGTVGTLSYFRFGVRKGEEHAPRYGWRPVRTPIGSVPIPWPILPFFGEIFIFVAFGVMFAGALSATLLYMTERLQFLSSALQTLLSGIFPIA
ncbi:MAG TPA: hypothetical protein VK449_06035 [Anaerolineales bacterium]|nr:hypothetical protein [Anaerolineales bacterium]